MTTYKRLGDYIREVNVRNRNLKVTNLLGVSISIYPNKMVFTRLVEATFSVIVHFFRKLFVSLGSEIGNME